MCVVPCTMSLCWAPDSIQGQRSVRISLRSVSQSSSNWVVLKSNGMWRRGIGRRARGSKALLRCGALELVELCLRWLKLISSRQAFWAYLDSTPIYHGRPMPPAQIRTCLSLSCARRLATLSAVRDLSCPWHADSIMKLIARLIGASATC